MRRPPDALVRFGLGLLGLLPVAVALWWWALPGALLPPLRLVTELGARALFTEEIVGVQLGERSFQVMTSLSAQDAPLDLIGFELEAASYTVGLPLLWALALATPRSRRVRNLLLGSLALLPAIAVALILGLQIGLADYVNHAPGVPDDVWVLTTPYSPTAAGVIDALVRPTRLLLVNLAAIVLWAAQNRRLLGPQLRAWSESPPNDRARGGAKG